MFLGAQGNWTEWGGSNASGLARESILIFWYPVPGSRVPGTRQLGARYGGIVVTSTESVDFWYRYVGTVATSTEIAILGTPNTDVFAFLAPPKCSESLVNNMFSEHYSILRRGS